MNVSQYAPTLIDYPLVYVLVLNWRTPLAAIRCVESVQKSTYLNYKILLIDNGSPDDSEKILRNRFPDIDFIQTGENKGYAGGNNAGIREALKKKAVYILILNSDVRVETDLISKLLEVAKLDSRSVVGPVIYQGEKTEEVGFYFSRWHPQSVRFRYSKELPAGYEEVFFDTAYTPGCAMLFPSKLADEIGLFDERFFLLWEDTDLCVRAKRGGYKIRTALKAKIIHEDSLSFEGGKKGGAYQYYDFRNQLLWIEKNLSFCGKFNAYMRLFLIFFEMIQSQPRKIFNRYKLKALLDYAARAFGPEKIEA